MKRGIMTEAVRNIDEEYRLEALNLLNQAEVSDLTNMKKNNARKILTIAIAATMTLALGGVVAAKSGVFGTTFRETEPDETVKVMTQEYDPETDTVTSIECTVDDVSAVVQFSGADVCNAIEFKLGYVPSNAIANDDESIQWFGSVYDWNDDMLEFRCSDDSFYKIETYYDPQFSFGGSLYTSDNVSNLEETIIGDYEVYKFWLNGQSETEWHEEDDLYEDGDDIIVPQNYVDYSFPVVIMHNPAGYIFVVTGQEVTLDDLTDVATNIEVRQTDKLVECTEFDGNSFEINGAAG